MKIFPLLLALSLLSITLALSINSQTVSDGKVKINVYYQPLCSLCQYFIHRSIKTAIATKVHSSNLGFLENLLDKSSSIRKGKAFSQ